MKISIHQPQYLPWLPYFQKIAESDLFVFLDSVDFQKNGLQNRNEIKTGQGRHWLTVPVNQKLGQKIKDTEINNNLNWKKKHFQTIKNCYCKSKFFVELEEYLEKLFSKDWTNLCELNIELTQVMMECLDINTPLILSSSLELNTSGSDLILDICKKNNASTYLSGMGGKEYLKINEFNEENIQLEFFDNKLPIDYPQLFPKISFMNDLSAIDIILNCGKSWRDVVKF